MAVLKTVAVITVAFLLIMLMSYWAAGRARPALDANLRAELLKKGIAHAFMELSDGTVQYRLEGPITGPLVVLIHGFSIPSFVWDNYFTPLTDAGYRVLAFDNYGRGFSDRPTGPYNADLSDRLMIELLDKLNLHEPAHLVGYSMGGAMATIFAARHPEKVRSLTLIAPAGLGVATDVQSPLLLRRPVGDWIVRMFELKIFHTKAAEEAKFAPNPARFLSEFDRQMDYRGYGDALLSTMRNYPLASSQAAYTQAGRSDRPVLIIWGEDDKTVPFANAKTMMNLMPHARLFSYPSLRHDIGFSQVPLVSSLITQFLDAQAATASSSQTTDSPGTRLGSRARDDVAR